MSSQHWDRLDAIAERISELTGRAHIASAHGDDEQAAYFMQQARRAEFERQTVVESLSMSVIETIQ